MVDATPTKPFCYREPEWFYRTDACIGCAYRLPCAVGAGVSADRPRKMFVESIARANIPRADAIEAIQKAYDVTHNAARKQYDRWREKLGRPQ
ncbi:hypothetical protein LCGC14_0461640 [marine sediment metagenome]|uniref:Uncharacterized protein n=1 Tax=marine sediment metagenome TaxID=412755 RepID=A0A0F9V1P8_9ZZZZ